jgi:threonine/homoserine/homoserine lactone efflux protein
MPSLSDLGLFGLASLALLLVPGPAVVYIVMRSVDQGRVAGFVSVAGIHTGTLIHVTAAAVGLSAIIATSAVAFSAVKYVGAAYLIYIGVRRLLEKDDVGSTEAPPPLALKRIYVQGFVVNLLNPKTALFFLAFLPQFVRPEAGSVPLQTIILGLTFVLIGLVSDSTYAFLASGAGSKFLASPAVARRRRYLTGAAYIGLGVTAAFATHTKTK